MQKYKDTVIYIIFMIVVIAWAFVRVKPEAIEYFQTRADIKNKTVEAADLERKLETLKAASLKNTVQIMGSNKKIFKPDEAGLEAEASFANVFDDVVEMAKFNGIKTRSIEYLYNPPEDTFIKGAKDKYNVCQLNMELIADYSDLESFLKDLYKYPYLVNVTKLEVVPYEKNKKILLVNFQLRLYSAKGGVQDDSSPDAMGMGMGM